MQINFIDWWKQTYPKESAKYFDPLYEGTEWKEVHLQFILDISKRAFEAGIECERKRHAWSSANTPESEKYLEMEYLLK
jgi:hypothetical protein